MPLHKRFSQHFLRYPQIAERIVKALMPAADEIIVEIGAGKGMLTQFLVQYYPQHELHLFEIERNALSYLKAYYSNTPKIKIFAKDILLQNLNTSRQYALIGNLPYRIASQVTFWTTRQHLQVPRAVFMYQKEVAQRLSARPGTKEYGLLSVIVQTFYEVKLLFTLSPSAFVPKPKVYSAVVKWERKNTFPEFPWETYFQIVKAAFNKRRKILKNNLPWVPEAYQKRRAEALSVADFITLTNFFLQQNINKK